MTLEKFIEHIKLNKHLYYEEEFERIVGFLEELKDLRVELEKNSKELEIYKKALDLAIQTNDMVRNEEEYKALLLKEASSQWNNKEWLENLLQKAREQNNDRERSS